MKRPNLQPKQTRLSFVTTSVRVPKPWGIAIACMVASTCLLGCGITAFAAHSSVPPEPSQSTAAAAETPGASAATPTAAITATATPAPVLLYPADVQHVVAEDGTRQIVKTYNLTIDQSPNAIPTESFEQDGWRYALTDITEQRNTSTATRIHTEPVELNTSTNAINDIMRQLAPTMDYHGDDGYIGTLTLDMSSVQCEAAGHKNSNYTVTATREYPHLSTMDLALIPKSITDNGRTLQLEDVSWEAQSLVGVDYNEIPDSYRAVVKYTATATRSVTTGYVTTAVYTGEVAKETGETIYHAHFTGNEIAPTPAADDETTTADGKTANASSSNNSGGNNNGSGNNNGNGNNNSNRDNSGNPASLKNVLLGIGVFTALMAIGAAVYVWLFLRRNVKIYNDEFCTLTAKDRISVKKPTIDLSPLESDRLYIELEKSVAKALNGQTIRIKHGDRIMTHDILFEGNAYRLDVSISTRSVLAVH